MKKNSISYCFVGAVAVNEYGFSRYTEDIQYLVDHKDKLRFELLAEPFLDSVDVIIGGTKLNNGKLHYPDPKQYMEIADGLPFMQLKYIIVYKIDSGMNNSNRPKDLPDVQELIKINNLPKELSQKSSIFLRSS